MFTNHTQQFWNDRYEKSDFAYGTEPNAFLVSQQHRLHSGTQALAVGDGEGRNGVWLAQQGLDVLSVDLSSAGLEKAQALARDKSVTLRTQQVDLSSWEWPENTFDLVISIYLHFPPDLRERMHQSMAKALKPKGLLMLEAFTPDQLAYQEKYQSGGPPKLDMLYTPDMLQQDFKDLEVLEIVETVTKLQEGQYHNGPAAVVRGVFGKER